MLCLETKRTNVNCVWYRALQLTLETKAIICSHTKHLSAIVQARHFSLFSHTVQMPDETDANKILTASPGELETTRTPLYYVIDWLSMVLRLCQHNIGYMADGFYRSDDRTNSVKALKEGG